MIEGFDYGSGPIPIDVIKANHRQFVCRYVKPGKWTQMLQPEYVQLRDFGIDIVAVWQNTKTRSAEGGFDGGAHDMNEAMEYVRSIGGPKDGPIYIVAGDFDAQPSDLPLIKSYVDGAVAARGHDLTGAYGGYNVIKYLSDANTCKYYWQTSSWSNGLWYPKANIQQYVHDTLINGYSVDFDRATTDDYGQWCQPPFAELFDC